MNRSNKGFGLTSVLVTVIFLIVAAIFSASAKSSTLSQSTHTPEVCQAFEDMKSQK
ncbi:MAG: hypothetical protein ABJH06_03040 [Paraglaciecola sp.]|uniref:hypothetical protein n=1 Tax=Paraglaciecola sp. TaxID=1920173 RepID=UPI003266F1B5